VAAGPVLADSLGCSIVDIAAAAGEVVGTGIDNSWRDRKESESKTLVIVSQVQIKDDEMR
jgi:hypothetical protein